MQRPLRPRHGNASAQGNGLLAEHSGGQKYRRGRRAFRQSGRRNPELRDPPACAHPDRTVGVSPKCRGTVVPSEPIGMVEMPPGSAVKYVHALIRAEPDPPPTAGPEEEPLIGMESILAREMAPVQ